MYWIAMWYVVPIYHACMQCIGVEEAFESKVTCQTDIFYCRASYYNMKLADLFLSQYIAT